MNVIAEELHRYYEPVTPYDFYRSIFPEGELDTGDEFTKGKYTAIALEITKEKKKAKNGRMVPVVYRHTVTDDLDKVDELQHSEHFCVMAPISYAGKSRESRNARVMYALGVELDNLRVKENGQQIGLENLIDRYSDRAHYIPKPTFIVASGNGVHLYYQFERPLVLFPNTVQTLKAYKEELTKMIWSRSVTYTHTDETIQQESIFQGFRMPGTPTKAGDRVAAFRVGEPVSLDYLNGFMRTSFKGRKNIVGVYKSDLRLEEAKEKFPEWYERRIVQKDKTRKPWALNRAVYDWWLQEIRDYAIDGHRYHCLMMLSIYAIKCGNYDAKKNPNPVTQEELEADAWGLLDDFNARTKREENPFTEYDILCALQVYEDRGMITYPRNSIAYKSGITITPQKPRRKRPLKRDNGDALAAARLIQNILDPNGSWREGNGRPSAQQTVEEWQHRNPGGTKKACKDETGLSYPTIRKWWR